MDGTAGRLWRIFTKLHPCFQGNLSSLISRLPMSTVRDLSPYYILTSYTLQYECLPENQSIAKCSKYQIKTKLYIIKISKYLDITLMLDDIKKIVLNIHLSDLDFAIWKTTMRERKLNLSSQAVKQVYRSPAIYIFINMLTI